MYCGNFKLKYQSCSSFVTTINYIGYVFESKDMTYSLIIQNACLYVNVLPRKSSFIFWMGVSVSEKNGYKQLYYVRL